MDERTSTAYHEASHAVMMYWVGQSFKTVTIVSEGETLGSVGPTTMPKRLREEMASGAIKSRVGRAWIQDRIMVLLAGYATQLHATGQDPLRGKTIMDSEHDYSEIAFLSALISTSDDERQAMIDWLTLGTRDVLFLPVVWAAVEALTAALLEHGQLTGRATKDIIQKAMA